MSAKTKAGLACICLGAALLIGALGLYQSNRREALEAEAASREIIAQMAETITEERTQGVPSPVEMPAELPLTEEPVLDTAMAAMEIDGYRYVGFLTIPDLALELPVMEEWDYDRLKIAPCRYSGTLLGGDLVIAAHNYLSHFGHLMELAIGSEILFTDVNGNLTRYSVAELEILQPTAVEDMTAGDYDLTLFTCTYGGATRFTVRCIRENG